MGYNFTSGYVVTSSLPIQPFDGRHPQNPHMLHAPGPITESQTKAPQILLVFRLYMTCSRGRPLLISPWT